jgi:hypothetical protein
VIGIGPTMSASSSSRVSSVACLRIRVMRLAFSGPYWPSRSAGRSYSPPQVGRYPEQPAERHTRLSGLPHTRVDVSGIEHASADSDVGVQGGDVVGLGHGLAEEFLLTGIKLDMRRKVVADRLLQVRSGAQLWLSGHRLAQGFGLCRIDHPAVIRTWDSPVPTLP